MIACNNWSSHSVYILVARRGGGAWGEGDWVTMELATSTMYTTRLDPTPTQFIVQ